MKKIEKEQSFDPKPVKLYLEDIENIFSLLSETYEKVLLRTDEFELESVDELKKLNIDNISRLSIIAHQDGWPSFLLSIFYDEIGIRIWKDNPTSLGVQEKIKQILKKRERSSFLQLLYNKAAAFIVLWFLLISLILSLSQKSSIVLLNILAIALTVLWVFFAYKSTQNLIILKHSINAPSFLKRNSEAILVTIITSIITLLLGYFFGKLTGANP